MVRIVSNANGVARPPYASQPHLHLYADLTPDLTDMLVQLHTGSDHHDMVCLSQEIGSARQCPGTVMRVHPIRDLTV